jgi:hypothetical protein
MSIEGQAHLWKHQNKGPNTEGQRLQQFTTAVDKLHALLHDPHPGLMMWNQMMSETWRDCVRIAEPALAEPPNLPIYWDDCTMEQLEWLLLHGSSQQRKVAQDCITDLKERGKL